MEEIAQHILDIARNSLEAGATVINISVEEKPENDRLEFFVYDNGAGMVPGDILRVTDPFYSGKGKRIGLGIPLLHAATQRCGGDLKISSVPGKGTEIKASFSYHHIDRPPLGNIGETISVLMAITSDVNITYRHIFNNKIFNFSTKELKDFLAGVPLNTPAVLVWVEGYVQKRINSLRGGFVSEIPGRVGKSTGEIEKANES